MLAVALLLGGLIMVTMRKQADKPVHSEPAARQAPEAGARREVGQATVRHST